MRKLNLKFELLFLSLIVMLSCFITLTVKRVYSDPLGLGVRQTPQLYNPSYSEKHLQKLDPLKPDRCRDELDSLHSVSDNGQFVVFVRTCFKQDFWDKRPDKSSPEITDNLWEVTIEEPSMVYVKDNISHTSYPLYAEGDGNNPNKKNLSVFSPVISDDGSTVAYLVGKPNHYSSVYMAKLEGNQVKNHLRIDEGANGSSWSPFVSGNGKYVVFSSTASNIPGGGNLFEIKAIPRSSGPLSIMGLATPPTAPSAPPEQTPSTPQTPALPAGSVGNYYVPRVQQPTQSPYLAPFSNILTTPIYLPSTQAPVLPATPVAPYATPGTTVPSQNLPVAPVNPNYIPSSQRPAEAPFVTPSPVLPANPAAPYYTPPMNLVFSKIFLYNTETKELKNITPTADGNSSFPSISGDGSRIAFSSQATNLVPSDTNQKEDVFLYEVASRIFTRVSTTLHDPTGNVNDQSSSPMISANGDWIVYTSIATNLALPNKVISDPIDSPHERANYRHDIFLYDVKNRSNRMITFPEGKSITTAPSPAKVGNLPITTPTTVGGRGDSWAPSITADGKYILFLSDRSDLLPGWEYSGEMVKAMLYDREDGRFYIQSAQGAVHQGNKWLSGWRVMDDAFYPSISADGSLTVFESKNILVDTLKTYSTTEIPDNPFSWGVVYMKSGLGPRSFGDPLPHTTTP